MHLASSLSYLDANATLPLKGQAKNAMLALMDEIGNPSSIHGFGRYMRAQIETARDKIAEAVFVQPAQVIFTSSGSEANNFALNAFAEKDILVSAVEHASILGKVPNAETIPVLSNGILDLDWLETRLKKKSKPKLISIMYANNETGVLHPLKKALKLIKQHGILVHCDAVQALGKYTLSFPKLEVDYMTISSHKIGGSQGVGALIVAKDAPLKPLIQGGGQERRRRSGTENVLGIVGFGAAMEACGHDDWERVRVMRDRIEQEINALDEDALIIKDTAVKRLPNTTCLRMPGMESQKQVMAFDLKGIAVSSGAACSSGKVEKSHVLQAMGIQTNDSIRVSLCPVTTDKDSEAFIKAWREIYETRESKEES